MNFGNFNVRSSRTESSGSIDTSSPRGYVESLLRRLKRGKALDDELADYFKERAAIEDRYAKDLLRLANTRQGTVDESQFGTFASVWGSLISSTIKLSETHGKLSTKLQDEIEQKLRHRADVDAEWSKLKTLEIDAQRVAKDFDDKVVKCHKAEGKVKRKAGDSRQQRKLEEAQSAYENSKGQWQQYVASFNKKFVGMDHQRWGVVKDVLQNYVSFEAMAIQGLQGVPDEVLASVLTFDGLDNTHAFMIASGGGKELTGSVSELPEETEAPGPGPGPAVMVEQPSVDEVPKVDEEGYTIRPVTTGPSPWDNVGNSSHNFSDDEDGDGESMAASTRFNIAIKKEPMAESRETAIQALKHVQATLSQTPSIASSRKRGTRKASEMADSRSFDSTFTDGFGTTGRSAAQGGPLDRFGAILNSNSVREEPDVLSADPVSIQFTISEVVNVLIRRGTIEKILLTGDVAISITKEVPDDQDPMGMFFINLNGRDRLDQVVPNQTYARLSSPFNTSQYSIDLEALVDSAEVGTHVPILKYQVKIDPDAAHRYIPILANPLWKCEEGVTSYLMAYQYNPTVSSKVEVNELMFMTSLATCHNPIHSVQMKPTGAWSPERRLILWKAESLHPPTDAAAGAVEPIKLLARFETEGACVPGSTAIKFQSQGALLSGIGIELVDPESSKKPIVLLTGVEKTVATGKYVVM
ncbi:muniscin domain-containing protein [Polychytrium aggregatum]|uniref:muniscin domain-containing protein n=1 Tax=Polychytrium aggregatum TaxID=110093 RepID=UPI0022FE7FC8|nr:muniscin domain-containing protein [Polychytrium aggregatum]KAI9197501.1 Muniscin C-terminal mu homology domain-containing protein [Polychytrium aggregatum]